jgi:hypothetical protein
MDWFIKPVPFTLYITVITGDIGLRRSFDVEAGGIIRKGRDSVASSRVKRRR